MGRFDLSDSEYEITQYIWERGEILTFQEIMQYTHSQGHEWKAQTVQTFLTRLIKKGVLKAEKEGRKKLYSAALTQQEYAAKWTRELLNTQFGGSLKGFISAFTGGERLSEEDARALHEMIDRE